MTCDQLSDEYSLFALGLSDGPELDSLRDHLRRECPTCRPGVSESFAVVASLGLLATPATPPARLRKRILAAVDPSLLESAASVIPPRSAFGWSVVWGALAAVFLMFAVLFGIQTRNLSLLRRSDTARLEQVLSLLSAPDSREISFGPSGKQVPIGRVLVNRRRGVALIASNLPAVSSGKAFELWLIPRGGSPIPSGMFRAQPDRSGIALHSGEVPENIGTVAVTVEDEGGAASPTSTPIIAANTD